jgi:DNA-binding MarR family transcriptional regulator
MDRRFKIFQAAELKALELQILELLGQRQKIDSQDLYLTFEASPTLYRQAMTNLEKRGLIKRRQRPSDRRRIDVILIQGSQTQDLNEDQNGAP